MTTTKEREGYNRLLTHIDTLELQVHRIRDQLEKLKNLIMSDHTNESRSNTNADTSAETPHD